MSEFYVTENMLNKQAQKIVETAKKLQKQYGINKHGKKELTRAAIRKEDYKKIVSSINSFMAKNKRDSVAPDELQIGELTLYRVSL